MDNYYKQEYKQIKLNSTNALSIARDKAKQVAGQFFYEMQIHHLVMSTAITPEEEAQHMLETQVRKNQSKGDLYIPEV